MKILDIAIKDLVRSFRNRFALGMMFVAPLLITGLIYLAFGGLSAGTGRLNLPPLNVAIANLDQPQAAGGLHLGQMLVDYLRDPRMPGWLHVTEIDEATARAALERQEVGVVIIVPADLSANALRPEGATLTLLQDPALTIGPAVVKDLLGVFADGLSGAKIAVGVTGAQLAAHGAALGPDDAQTIGAEYSTWFTALQQNLHHSATPLLAVQAPPAGSASASNANSMSQLIGQIMAGMLIFFVFYSGAYSALSILREDEEGTLARLFTTPTPRSQVLAGKFVAIFLIAGVQSVVLLVASGLAFNIAWGLLLSIAITTFSMVIVASGFGLLLLSFVKTARQSGPVLGGGLTVTAMLGGLFSPAISNLPAAFNAAALVMPQGWAMRAWKLVLDGAGPGDIVLPVAVMLGLGVICFGLGVVRFQKRFA